MSLVGSSTSNSKRIGKVLIEQAGAAAPIRGSSGLDRRPEVAPVKVGIGTVDLDGLVPNHRLQPELRLPVEFDERGLLLWR